ncbi:MAG: penicillin acylase family protein, partial [Planctomycetota bacterium]
MLPSSDRPVRIMLAFLVLLVFQLQAFAQQQLELPSIDKHVEILADDRGVPVVRAQTYDDAVAALGFLHGRDRFFQMDAMRRLGSGRLAELLGSSQIGRDEEIRRQQVGEAARTALDLLQPDNRAALRRYVAGVNAGLASLPVLPPEYLILGSRPEPWTELDAMHVTVALMRMLSDMQDREQIETEIFSSLDPQIVALLDPARTSLDAEIPVQADWWLDERLQSSLPALPGPDVVDFRDDDTPRKELYRVLGRRAPLDDWPE